MAGELVKCYACKDFSRNGGTCAGARTLAGCRQVRRIMGTPSISARGVVNQTRRGASFGSQGRGRPGQRRN